ncbi:MAG: Flp pilus assembly complex ATPase component TadA [Rhodothermales bacterium]|nr:Flp pilus assembly complex ATPase component TadA [Rhodothermales bacterium]
MNSNSSIKEILARQAAAKRQSTSVPKPTERSPISPPGSDQAGTSKIASFKLHIPPLPEVCKELAGDIPYALYGDDRIRYTLEQIGSLSDKERTALRIHVEHFLNRMIEVDASDIDFGGTSANKGIWYRLDGDKKPDESMGEYTVDETNVLILNLVSSAQFDLLFKRRAIDISYTMPVEGRDGRNRRLRCTVYFDFDQIALNMRLIGDIIRPLKSLNFHPRIEKGLLFRHERDGLTLVTGVTGSGKSTTLDSIIDENNKDVHGHGVIIAQPIEYMHSSKRCILRHREVGKDVPSFKDGIVQALRQDPDIIVIGELRDPETISAALEVTDSGHKVFSTLHTSSAVESIDRMIAEYPSDEQERVRNRLAEVLKCVISQKLPPKIGGGRVLTKEVLWMTSSSRAAIKNDNTSEIYQMMWEGWAEGQITLEQDLARLVKEGQISVETAMDYANVKRRLRQLLG